MNRLSHPLEHVVCIQKEAPGWPEASHETVSASRHERRSTPWPQTHIHQYLQVIETEGDAIAPHPGLILERTRERGGEEGTLLAAVLPDRHFVNGSLPFDPQAAAVWIRGTAGVVRISGAVGILDRIRRVRRTIATVGVTGRIRIIGVRAELAAVVPLLVIQARRIGSERIRGRLVAEVTTVGTEGIVQAVWLEGASGSVGIGGGLRIVRVRAQLAEIFRMDGDR
jgi:hypothetical protein